MEKKRKGYQNSKAQVEANKRYLEKHPEQRKKKRVGTLRSECKNFIRNHATLDEITDLRTLLKEREELLRSE
ncbi:MAG: hypothetical protein HXO49_03430 [Prevotella sp.]|nr:hypothetical protein [Prevotella sp.]